MINTDFEGISLKLKQEANTTFVFDIVRHKWLVLTPEEHVRQYLLYFLVEKQGYPIGMVSVEKSIKVGNMNKRFDIVVYDRDHKPWLLVECKEPETDISESTLHQLLNYQRTMKCNYWVLSNGRSTYCADARDIDNIKWLDELPAYDS